MWAADLNRCVASEINHGGVAENGVEFPEVLRDSGDDGKALGYEDVFRKIVVCRKHYEACGPGG